VKKAFALGAPGLSLVLPGAVHTAGTVRSQDGTDFTCDVPPGLDLSAFAVGMRVKPHCHRLDGAFRLGASSRKRPSWRFRTNLPQP
jgi:hypothetical protein